MSGSSMAKLGSRPSALAGAHSAVAADRRVPSRLVDEAIALVPGRQWNGGHAAHAAESTRQRSARLVAYQCGQDSVTCSLARHTVPPVVQSKECNCGEVVLLSQYKLRLASVANVPNIIPVGSREQCRIAPNAGVLCSRRTWSLSVSVRCARRNCGGRRTR